MNWTHLVSFAIEALRSILKHRCVQGLQTAFNLVYFLSVLRTIFLVLLFSQYARNVKFPLPIYKSKKGWTAYKLQLFKMFPVSTLFFFWQYCLWFICDMFSEGRVLSRSSVGGQCLCADIGVLMSTKLLCTLRCESGGSFRSWNPFNSRKEDIDCLWGSGSSDSMCLCRHTVHYSYHTSRVRVQLALPA